MGHDVLLHHGHLISTLSLTCWINEPADHGDLELLSELVPQQCSNVELFLRTGEPEEVDLAGLQALSGKLWGLKIEGDNYERLLGFSTLTGLPKLTCLSLSIGMPLADPWTVLSTLTRLQHLACSFKATADAAPLSMLTGLTSVLATWLLLHL
jgi:hypothetical protein